MQPGLPAIVRGVSGLSSQSHTLGEQGPHQCIIIKTLLFGEAWGNTPERPWGLTIRLQSAHGVPGRELDDSSCRLSRTPSSYKASFCTIFCRAGLMTICGGRDDAELPRSDPGVERAPS